MPTVTLNVTTSPTDLIAALSLTEGNEYSMQNVGNADVLFAEVATAPDEGSRDGNILGSEMWENFEAGSTPIYVWVIGDPPGRLTVNDA